MSLQVCPKKGILKRKSEEQLRQSESDEEARRAKAQVENEVLGLRIRRSNPKPGYVERPVRQRKTPFCCHCQRECVVEGVVEGDEGGGQCRTCGHYRCVFCCAGCPKRARKAGEKGRNGAETEEISVTIKIE